MFLFGTTAWGILHWDRRRGNIPMANKKNIYSDEMRLLVRHIKEARIAAGLTQEELAFKLGKKTHSAIAKLEQGQVRVEFFDLRRICQILEVPFMEFVGRLEGDLASEGDADQDHGP